MYRLSTTYGKQGDYTESMDATKKGRAEGLNQVSNALFEKAKDVYSPP